MKFYSALIDKKIMGLNVAIEMTIGEYFEFAEKIIDNNDLQRTKVKTSNKPYELLEKDLVSGCVIPPIILAISGEESKDFIYEVINGGKANEFMSDIQKIIAHDFSLNRVMILDGLQRTLTIKSIIDSFKEREGNDSDDINANNLEDFLKLPLRFEVYLGLSKQGILYRMLTLNTGQTPMSFRHQLEILYKDYLNSDNLGDDIQVYKEVDEKRARGLSKYKFSDVIDMFYAHSTGSPLPYDKQAIVGALKEISFLEDYQFKRNSDLMNELLIGYNKFVVYIDKISNGWEFDENRFNSRIKPFGTNIASIFAKGQVMAAFGAESKRLVEKRVYSSLDGVLDVLFDCSYSKNTEESIDALIMVVSEVAEKAKKIGDAQRLYFQLFFRSLLSEDYESFKDISASVYKAQEVYEMMY